jgi:hypothetical protein
MPQATMNMAFGQWKTAAMCTFKICDKGLYLWHSPVTPERLPFVLLRPRSANHRRAIDCRDAIAVLLHGAASDATREVTSVSPPSSSRHPKFFRPVPTSYSFPPPNPGGTRENCRLAEMTRTANAYVFAPSLGWRSDPRLCPFPSRRQLETGQCSFTWRSGVLRLQPGDLGCPPGTGFISR